MQHTSSFQMHLGKRMIRLLHTHLKTHAKRKKEKIERLSIRLFISSGDHDERSKKKERERESKKK